MSDSGNHTWSIGSVELHRVPYFDIGLPADGIDLGGVADSVDWSEPWLTDGEPTVGQAFWIIKSGGETLVVDPCGASDVFLRSGPDAVGHQKAAFDLFRAAGHDSDTVDHVVFTISTASEWRPSPMARTPATRRGHRRSRTPI